MKMEAQGDIKNMKRMSLQNMLMDSGFSRMTLLYSHLSKELGCFLISRPWPMGGVISCI